MEDHSTIPYLREVVIFLVSAGLVVPLMNRLRINPVLGYLIVGGIIGPFGLGLLVADVPILGLAVIADIEGVKPLAELGVVFLLFMIGLELSFDRLWTMRRLVFGLGSAQIGVTGLIIGTIAYGFGNSLAASIVLGACLALSSTAIVMQLLISSRRLGSSVGRASFAILLMQDLAVVPILFLVGVFGADEGANIGMDLLIALGKAGLAISLIYVAGRLVLRPVLRLVAQARSPEMFMAAILLTVVGTSAITGFAGLSMALGAFMAGLVIAETEFRQEVEVDIEPFKGLMLALFFMSVGMGIDWRLIVAEPFWIPASVVGLIVLKSAIVQALCLAFGLPRHTAFETGLLMGQGGEFAFIVIGLAMKLGLLPRDVGQFMLIVAGLTMMLTPLVGSLASRFAGRIERDSAKRTLAWGLAAWRELEGHIILAGFGRVGHTLAATLDAEGVTYVGLDADPNNVTRARAEHRPVFYGDASRLAILNRAQIATAQAVVITMDAPETAERIVRQIRREWPLVPIYARARDGAHAARLVAAGATVAVPEAIEASLQLAGRVLAGLGASEEAVRRRLDQQRAIEETP